MIRSRLLEIPGWYCRWARVSRIETFRFFKNISPRSRFVLARRTLAELAKCEGIPLVFRIESLIFDDSEFWLEPIALDRFRKVHGFASSLLPPPFFVLPSSYCFGIEIVGSGFYEFSIFRKWNRRYLGRIESRFWKEFNTKYLCDSLS